MSITGGNLYFVSIKDPNDKLEIQFVPPELSITRTPDISEIKIVGRNNPLYQYASGTTELSFELDFYADEESREDVIRKCRWLESFTFNDGYENPPSQIKLVYGSLFRNEVWIIKRVDYRLSQFHKEKGYLPQQAYARITLALDPKFNLKIEDVR